MTPPIERANVTTHQPDNHKMKPTEKQLTVIERAYRDAETISSGVKDAIEAWESIRPADEPDRWIPLSERRPTAEDADDQGYVLVWSEVSRVTGAMSLNYLANYDITHWRRTNLPLPTEAEIEAKEIRAAYEADDGAYPFDSFKAGWLACKSKTAKP